MKVCLICVEIFAWGKMGGFGSATRTIARSLKTRGLDVCVVVPRRRDQKEVEVLDNFTVYSYPRHDPFYARTIFKECDADIYHSQEPSFATYLAMRSMPEKKHVVTFQDTRVLSDWLTELTHPSRNKLQVLSNILFEDNPIVRGCVKKADALCAAADLVINKAHKKYKLDRAPRFMPNPVEVPEFVQKSATPTVCFIGRWDRVKRPELFLQLAAKMPDINFIATGSAQDKEVDARIRNKYKHVPNLEMTGFIDQFTSDRLTKILSKSWIMVNTSAKEALPISFEEAAAHRCAIVSSVDPDGFTSRFGKVVDNEDYSAGIRYLLDDDRWRVCGERGYEFVNKHVSLDIVITQHITLYENLLGSNTGTVG
ncbi:MAG: glycosyltransferase family 4 protein [Candidatus Omnitrophica bacterium]|nr:glycosyltransferase family 4 protein [Candidatus Omnitrophota bacterium]